MRNYRFIIPLTAIAVFLCVSFKNPKAIIKTIVIDAGHGGHDVGCHYGGKNEKDITLKVSLLLGQMLRDSFPEVGVIFTRSSDSFVELHERANIANRNNADFFISVHVNASTSTTAYGTETYAMGLHKTEGNLAVAKRENESALLESNYQSNYDGFDPNSPEGSIIFTMFQSQFLNQSLKLASNVEQEFKKTNRYSRGVKQAGFLVLWKTSMPSILVETGYLSNAIERKFLTSEDGQMATALSIFEAFKQYKKDAEK
ncbi:MAG: N-acetylmuramoyl-L-alanine amidase [Flavobacteriaceae bacterium]|nr:N-acetylmuramoyl-L-alanine amidase [Flavobacteriaceae bacterium]